ncbi:MAG: glycosyltransferase [Acidimicrobiales bacterium]
MDAETSAPPVVAVVLTSDPGEWFEQTLVALATQDYPNQSVLVMDTGSTPVPASRVAEILPEAYLRRPEVKGFAAVANDVLQIVEGAAFLVFCHDDVALERPAVRLLVEEALRSNAGIVAPKVVEWERPDHLLEVGLAIDKTGASGPLVERGELDQEQHDAVRDVFAVSTTCLLVRQDLFSTLGGFDPVLADESAGVDLCWRAQVAGARVVVAPQARARHRERGTPDNGAPGDKAGIETRSHLHTILKSYSLPHLVRVLPQAAVVTVFEAIVAVASRRFRQAGQLVAAWWWNLRRVGELRPLRRAVRRARTVPDSEVRRLQVRGSVRFTAYVHHRLHAQERAQALVAAGENLVESVWKGPARAAGLLLGLLVLMWLAGARHLLGDRLPAVGELAPLPAPGALLANFFGGWRTTGLGSTAAAPPVLGILGVLGGLVFGHVDVLQKVLVLGAWPMAALGAWSLTRPLSSPLPRLVGVVAYLAVPLPYNALSRGRWGALVAYAAAPWLLGRLARATGLEPFASPEGDARRRAPKWLDPLVLGLITAVVAMLAPAIGAALLLAAVGLVVGAIVVGQADGALRVLGVTAAALVVAAVLLLPWSFDLLRPGGFTTVTGVARATGRATELGQLLRFQTGPMGAGPLGWALLVVAALPLVVGKDWRLAWATRLWLVALTCVVAAWAGGRGLLPVRFEVPDVLLTPAAAAIALAAAIGAVAFEVDLRGHRFGWRQTASAAAGAVLALSTVPVLVGARDGRWGLPAEEAARSIASLGSSPSEGSFRVLWLGDPEVLPLPGWPLGRVTGIEGVAYATSRDGPPAVTDLLPGPPSEETRAIAGAVRDASEGGTSRLGSLLAPLAVRYVVVPRQAAAGRSSSRSAIPPAALSQALRSQLDLRLLASDDSAVVYQNEAWGPGRSLLGSQATTGMDPGGALPRQLGKGADLSGSTPVLDSGGPVEFDGRLPRPGLVLLSESSSSRWALTVDGSGVARSEGYGVNSFRADRAGPARLRFRASPIRLVLISVELLLWAAAFWLLWRGRAAHKR